MAGKVSDKHATLLPVTSQPAFDAYTSATPPSTLLVLYFAAPWAAPCEQMSTVLSTLASTYPVADPPRVVFLSINTDDLPDIAEQYDVTAVPYVVLQKDKKILETISGGDAAKVRAAVERHAGAGSGSSSTQLPPAQSVERPEQQPVAAAGAMNGMSNGTKNLGAYAPTDNTPNGTAASQKTRDEPLGNPITEKDINTRCAELVHAAPVMLFMKGTPSAPQCGFSRQLVSTLRENSVRYGFFNILADEEIRQGLKTYADWPTFPQLWLDGELVGGLDIVKEELENDPDFLKRYSVDSTKKTAGGPAGAESQARPTATV